MMLHVFSVFDAKVGAFMTPFFARSRGEALRSFADACADEKHSFARHASDYELYVVGTFDDSEGCFVFGVVNERLCGASDYVLAVKKDVER